ncbi:hypothetical protein DL93DRAFT_2164755 [Clavulina sp. PMI_390]|nr:hypothetical protein DL93DRAFT_2164755 [Clavulina sp. PMI_390]
MNKLEFFSIPSGHQLHVDAPDHPIVEVTVYQSDRAIVQRRFPLDVKIGQNAIRIKNLSSFIDGDSIRVEAQTTSYSQGLSIVDVVYTPSTGVAIIGPPIPQTPEVKGLHAEKAALEMRYGILESHQTLLTGYAGSLRDGRIESATNETLIPFMELNLEKQTQLWKEKQQLGKEIKVLADRIAEMRVEEKFASPGLGSEVAVVLVAEEAGAIELVLSYVVRRASWTSSYDIRADLYGVETSSASADKNGPTVRLQYRASVTQMTGEDWKDVPITLSTASPQIGAKIPKVKPWRITAKKPSELPQWGPYGTLGAYPPPNVAIIPPRTGATTQTGYGMMHQAPMASPSVLGPSVYPPPGAAIPSGVGFPPGGFGAASIPDGIVPPNLFGGPTPQFAAVVPPSPVVYDEGPAARVGNGMISTTFTVEGLSNIPSDGTNHKVSIASMDLNAELEWIVVPRSVPSAFLQCRIKNQSSYQLIAGPSSVFLDGKFVAKSSLPNVSPSEHFTCSLGVDPSVRITFHPQSRVSSTTGGTGLSSFLAANSTKTTVTAYKQRITIKNTRASSAISRLVVQDRVPVSEDANIKVTLLQPSETALGPVTGLLAKDSSTAGSAKEPQLVDQISKDVMARWAQKEEEGSGSGGARGDGVIEWIVTDLKDSVDLHLAFDVARPSDVSVVDAK